VAGADNALIPTRFCQVRLFKVAPLHRENIMKLFALVSIVALTAATAAFAQDTPAGSNPSNCSPGMPNCATSGSGSNVVSPAPGSASQGMTMRPSGQITKQRAQTAAMTPAPGAKHKAMKKSVKKGSAQRTCDDYAYQSQDAKDCAAGKIKPPSR
jgi:hypothetical protein